MKFEREKDIPVFQGKTWRERTVLRSQARERDHSIFWLQGLMGALAAPTIALSKWLIQAHPSWLLLTAVYFLLGYPVVTLFQGLFITPRIRRALESDAKPAA